MGEEIFPASSRATETLSIYQNSQKPCKKLAFRKMKLQPIWAVIFIGYSKAVSASMKNGVESLGSVAVGALAGLSAPPPMSR